MATKKKPTTKKAADESTTVTRISATDTKPKTAKKETAPVNKPISQTTNSTKQSGANGFGRLATPFVALGRYFKGAWYELRQVRWPNRRATWSLTAAVIGFTAFFAVLILLLDALFKYLFQLILG